MPPIHCSSCGVELLTLSNFCAECGASLDQQETALAVPAPKAPAQQAKGTASQGDTDAQSALLCPTCRTIDKVQSVSAIVSAGAFTGAIVGSGHVTSTVKNATGTTRTRLAQQLALRDRPKISSISNWDLVGGLIGVLILAYGMTAAIVVGVLYFRFGIDPGQTWHKPLIPVIVTGIVLVATIGLTLIGKALERQRVAAQMPIWENYYGRWKQLYYCQRCNSVFMPGQPTVARE